MPVDTSIYKIPDPPNFLAMGQQAVGLGNSVLQNQLLRGEVQGRTQFGNAFAGATNPDGTVNTNALGAAIPGVNPLYAPAAAAAVQSLRTQNLANQGSQTDQNNARINSFYSALGPMALSGGKLTRQQVIAEAARRVATGQMQPADFVAVNNITPAGDKDVDAFVKQRYQQTLPDLSSVQPGGITPEGAQVNKPKAQILNEMTKPAAAAPSGASASGAAGVKMELSPIEKADQAEYLNDQGKSAATLANVRPLQQALPLAQALINNPGNFGPGSAELAKAKAALANFGVIDPNTSDGAVRQEIGKYLLRYASQAQAAGRSDQALSAAMGSNPNPDTMMQPAVLNLVKNQIGMDRMDAAIPLAAGKFNNYKDYKAKFYQSQDPRAYRFDMMEPAEQQALAGSLKDADRAKFLNSLKNAAKVSGQNGQ